MRNKTHILLVEDDVLFGECMRCGLSYYDCNVKLVESRTAWSSLRAKNFDMMILDLDSLKFSGKELLRKIRLKNSALPIIAIGGCDSFYDRAKSLAIGVDKYISKPFDFEDLYVRIHAIQERSTSCAKPIIAVEDISNNKPCL
ncbi:MAG: QseB [uncultured bacterium]|nr:MAG: QseB [uncultured bacterium]